MTPFVHLHVHSSYSLLDSTVCINELVDAAAGQEVKAVALTDHGVMHGVIDFYKQCQKQGVRPLIGCEMYVAREGRRVKHGEAQGNPNDHLVLLARNLEGYHNLARLSSIAHLEGFHHKPRIDKELLARYGKGLIGLSGCLQGEISQHLAGGDMPGAVRAAGEYAEIFGENGFYLEFTDHGIPQERKVNRSLGELARKTGLPIVATNDVHYLRREHADAHEVLLCLQADMVMSDPLRMRFPTPEFYLKTGDEMARLSAEFPDAVLRTVEVAEQCDVKLEFGQLHFPAYKPPEGLTTLQFMTRLCQEGMTRIYGVGDADHPRTDREKEVVERCRHELGIIERTGFLDYFLVVWDYVNFAKTHGIPVGPGRGSSPSSLVAYLLGITAVDPIRFGLVFERLLNPERVIPPDIDIDFCHSRRGEVVEYVKQKYGRDHVAQIITFATFTPKTAIRDIGRVLEIPLVKINKITEMVPDDPWMTLNRALGDNAKFKSAFRNDPDCKGILDYAFVLEGLYRNPGVHAAGVVISGKPLIDILPLCRDKNGDPVTQYPLDPVSEIGLIRMDFLGLKALTENQTTVEMIRDDRGVTVDLDRIPLDDKPTYDLIKTGNTAGIFYLESKGLQALFRETGIHNIEELSASIALYRPGPMAMLQDYLARKAGKTKITYDHPLLEPILKETYGVIVYQEQVLQAANVLAGFTFGGADRLRRAMGRRGNEEMARQRAAFLAGSMSVNGIPPDQAARFFDNLTQYAAYAFNKAHATAYALLAYQTAYLKSNYPKEYMRAVKIEGQQEKDKNGCE
jgi:DNA polymerase-3 subunit alpha